MKGGWFTRMTASNQLLKGGALRVGQFFFTILSTLIVMPVLIGGLGDRMYGMWALIGSILVYYEFFDLGLGQTTVRFLSKSFAEEKLEVSISVFSNSVFLFTLIGIIFALISTAVGLLGSHLFSNPVDAHVFRTSVLILGANFSINVPFYAMEAGLAAKMRFDAIAYAKIANIIIRTITFICVINSGYSVIGLSIAAVGTSLIYRALIVGSFLRLVPELKFRKGVISLTEMAAMFHHGKYVFLHNLSTESQFRLSNVLATALISLQAVTPLSIAVRLAEYAKIISGLVFSIFLPLFSMKTDNREQFKNAFWLVHYLNVSFATTLFGCALILGPAFIELWLGPSYEESYPVLGILLIGLAPRQMQLAASQALVALSKHKQSSVLTFIETALAILLAVLFGMSHGLNGIAFGLVLPGFVSGLTVYPYVAARNLSVSLRQYYLTLCLAFFPVAGFLSLAASFIWNSGSPSLWIFFASGSTFVAGSIIISLIAMPSQARQLFLKNMPIHRIT